MIFKYAIFFPVLVSLGLVAYYLVRRSAQIQSVPMFLYLGILSMVGLGELLKQLFALYGAATYSIAFLESDGGRSSAPAVLLAYSKQGLVIALAMWAIGVPHLRWLSTLGKRGDQSGT
jgi:hypothetical protein